MTDVSTLPSPTDAPAVTLAGAPVHTADADAAWWRTPSSTRSTRARSPTPTATASATCPASPRACRYLRDLGVDAVWLSPVLHARRRPTPATTSPTTATSTRSSARWPTSTRCSRAPTSSACKVIVDLVPNHSSDEHEWFQAALAAGPGQPRARALHVPRRPGRARRAAAEQLGVASSAARRGPASPRPTARPASGTCTCSTPSSPTSTGSNPEVRDRVRGRSCGSGSTAASTASASTSRTAWSRRTACPTGPRRRRCWATPTTPSPEARLRGRQAGPDVGPGRRARDLPRLARGARRLRRPTASSCAEAWVAAAGAAGPLRAPRRDAPGVQLRLPGDAPGTPPRCATVIDVLAARPTTRSAPRPPGCCRTTTSCATPPGSGCPPARRRPNGIGAGDPQPDADARPAPGPRRDRC